MPQKLEAELRKQLEDLYEPLAAANVAFHNSQSAEDQAVVQKFERQMNKLVDQLIALDDSPNA